MSTLEAGRPNERSKRGGSRVPDAELMRRVGDGDAAAYDALVRRYWAPLVRYATPMLGRVDDAKDAVQEALVRVWRHRARWDPDAGTVQAYLYRVTRNAALDATRKRGVHERWIARTRGTVPRSTPGPADRLERDAVLAAFDRAVQALPRRRREVFTLVFLHELSYAEAAAALGIAPKTVANQMWAAYAEIRRALAEFRPPAATTDSESSEADAP